MPQVSKRPLPKDELQRLHSLLWETISDLKTPPKVEEFFNDLLTPTEKIMLSKRLAIAVMLLKGYDYLTIKSYLKVSPTTIGSVSFWLKYSGSGYRKMVENLLKKERFKDLEESIRSTIDLLAPRKTFGQVLSKGFPKGKFKKPF